jgi:hypothetical protein
MRWLALQVRQQFLGFIALFIVLGGVSYAAATLPTNSVGSKQIKKDAVNGSKVKDGSLLAGDFKAGQIPAGPQGAKGDTGAKGATGAKGDIGPKGEPGPTVSAFAENSDGLALTASSAVVNQVTITIKVQSRLVAQASVDANASTAANLFCFINDDPGLSGAGDWSIRTNNDFTGQQNASIVGAKVLPAGTYTVFLACGKNIGTVSYNESDLAVIATGV